MWKPSRRFGQFGCFVNRLGHWLFGNMCRMVGRKRNVEDDVSKHLVEAVDMAVGDMRLAELIAR